ncbi:MAG: branched-chain alpha-keto acid dehydrogenase subunit E2, partial [Pseudomonadota bacterium]
MWKHLAANFMTLAVVLVACLAAIIGIGQSRWADEGPLAEATFFEVPRGASLRDVSEGLEAAG